MRPIALLILGWPLAEIAGIAVVGGRIGAINTLLLVIGSAMLGLSIVRRQGIGALLAASRDIRERPPNMGEVLDGVAVAFAGVLLIIPGFLSDIVGLLLLIPAVRQTIGAWAVQNLLAGERVIVTGAAEFGGRGREGAGQEGGPTHLGGGEVIDVTYTEIDPDEGKPPSGKR